MRIWVFDPDRVDVDYVWPQTLRLPSRPPKLVYLDLNHWIALSKAMAGHWDGAAHADALARVLRAADHRTAVFPLSDSIYSEISKIGPHRQRRDLRQVIERVSGHMVGRVADMSDSEVHGDVEGTEGRVAAGRDIHGGVQIINIAKTPWPNAPIRGSRSPEAWRPSSPPSPRLQRDHGPLLMWGRVDQ